MLNFIKTNFYREKIGKFILEFLEYDNCYYEVKVKDEDILITFDKEKAQKHFEEKKEKLLREQILENLKN